MIRRCFASAALLVLLFVVAGARADFPPLYLKPVSLGEIHSPTNIVHAADGTGCLFVCDQGGVIHIIHGGMRRPVSFLNLAGRIIGTNTSYTERGLLGLAFHPGYANPVSPGYGKFYVYYSKSYVSGTDPPPLVVGDPTDHVSVISEFRVSAADPNVADPYTVYERRLLAFTQTQFNHNGGQLEFGPDGYLYISFGDGGGANDNQRGHSGNTGSANPPTICGYLGNAQDRTRLFGKIIRIDPLGTNGPGGQYGIPASNPFVGAGGGVRGEIYAFGLRNPWKFSFDKRPGGTNRLFCCDVGQNRVEEVNIITSGGNYGWRIKEGSDNFDSTAPNPSGIALTPPIAEYAHPNVNNGMPELGLSGTGGYIYRGSAIPALQGKYVFGDYGPTAGLTTVRIMGLEETAPLSGVFTLTPAIPLLGGNPIPTRVLCLGEDENGELYVGTKITAGVTQLSNALPAGGIYKIVAAPPLVQELTLEPAKDNSIFSESETGSNGAGNLFAGRGTIGSTGDFRRALMAFDLTPVPSGSRFVTANLQLNVNQVDPSNPGAVNFTLNRLVEQWGEGTSFSTTGGAPATTNDATWLHRLYPGTFWSDTGGIFDGTTSATTSVNGTGAYTWQGTQLLFDLQTWLDVPEENFGWILRSTEVSQGTAKRFDSRESAAPVRPRLFLAAVPPTHFENWLATHYPSNLTGKWVDPNGDDDGDAIKNQVEYAYGFNPKAVNTSDGFTTALAPAGGGSSQWTITFRRDSAATDLTYRLQVSPDLVGWTTIAQSAAGATATGLNGGSVLSDNLISGTQRLVTVQQTLPPGDNGKKFTRLQIDRQP